ncbi:related to Protein AIM7 [Saccharomycodes ludwigii]|uniref:Related to Protein AIM7 n=1 Tax=Saccharomycodes ludwigii TaxID=36035 RepID=A0A376BDF5_9ASCO|nr:related to Protein AIM7 [Saccharomycodes ludwigii]
MSLFNFPTETKQQIRTFRTSTSRSDKLQHLIIKIEPKPSYSIVIDDGKDNDDDDWDDISDAHSEGLNNLNELREILPDNTPRFILLSYPMTSKDGRKLTLLVLLYWKPSTVVSNEWKMLYAGCLEMVKSECSPNKFIEVSSGLEDEEDVEDLINAIEA